MGEIDVPGVRGLKREQNSSINPGTRRDERLDALRAIEAPRELVWWGMGCFHFGLATSPPQGWTIADYLAEVTRSLRANTALQ